MNIKKNTHSLNTNSKAKDKQFQAQMTVVFRAFFERPKTMLMVSIETGIERGNICRYVGKWKEENRIEVFKIGICPISRNGSVQVLTTNPELFPVNPQLDLFIHSNTGSHD